MFTHLLQETNPDFYKIEKHSLYHDAVCLVISQRIAFTRSRQIRQELYKICFPFTSEKISKIKLEDFISNKNTIDCIKQLTLLEQESKLTMKTIKNIKGIGIWTIKALQIMNHEKVNVFLKEDAWIRKRLSQIIYGQDRKLSSKQAEDIIRDVNVNFTELSCFLWRLKESGVEKIRNGEKLLRADFL